MLAAGTTLGPYKVLAPLGAGGMGEVYRARDPRLERDVAIKVLPQSVTVEPTARARLIREARSAAALSHPNICHVYEVAEDDGRVYLAMELVEGQTLGQRIGGKPLPVESVIRYGVQIADALAHAHERHVIHRDLKSGNVMVMASGRVKVLDFGLAKRVWEVDEHGPTQPQVTLTESGVVVGTPHYLAPEVLHGAKADTVSDVWALGVVLYEMAAGVLPFRGQTGYELTAAILNATPVALPEQVPAGLRATIARCLAKEPGERFQRASEVRSALEALISQAAPVPVAARRWRRRVLWTAGAVIGLGFAIGLARLFWQRMAHSPELSEQELTSNPIELPVATAAISPDGRLLLFVDSTGTYLRTIATGETHEVQMPEGTRNSASTFCWFRDGTKFLSDAYPPGRDTLGSIWETSILGWSTRRLRDRGWEPTVSPDGSRIAFTQGNWTSREIWLMGPNGEDAHRLGAAEPEDWISSLAFSPDGQWIAYMRFHEAASEPAQAGSTYSLECRDVKRGLSTVLLKDSRLGGSWGVTNCLSWLPDGRIVYVRDDLPPKWNSQSLWEVRVDPTKGRVLDEPRRITNWSDVSLSGISASADGKHLALAKNEIQYDVYVADIDPTRGQLNTPRRLTLDDRADLISAWMPDSRAVLLSSDRRGNWDIFEQQIDRSTAAPLVTGPEMEFGAHPSPDGAWILYWAWSSHEGFEQRSLRLMRVPTSGGPPQIVQEAEPSMWNGWWPSDFRCATSPETLCVVKEELGRAIVFSELNPMSGKGREVARLDRSDTTESCTWDLSHDGSRIAAVLRGEKALTIHILNLRGETDEDIHIKERNLLQGSSISWLRWSPIADAVLITAGRDLFQIDRAGHARVLYRGESGHLKIQNPVPSPNGKHLAFWGMAMHSNVWLIDYP